MRLFFAVSLMLAAACNKSTSYQSFQEASGQFIADLPVEWHRDGQDDLARRPAATMTWIGAVEAEKEGRQVGAMIHISRFQRKDAPLAFKRSTLDPTDTMFGPGPLPAGAPSVVIPLSIDGRPARRYRRDFEEILGGGMHGTTNPIPMRLEDVVIETPDAYFVLEYRATRNIFEKHHPVFERLISTFRLAK